MGGCCGKEEPKDSNVEKKQVAEKTQEIDQDKQEEKKADGTSSDVGKKQEPQEQDIQVNTQIEQEKVEEPKTMEIKIDQVEGLFF